MGFDARNFRVRVLLDSVSPATPRYPRGKRLLSFKLRFPREILAEVNTHCILAKCAQSSRAIPPWKNQQIVAESPWLPEMARDEPGMVANSLFEGEELKSLQKDWLEARDAMLTIAKRMADKGVAKVVPNRLTEPFGWTNSVITGTEWANFFALRTDTDAAPAFRLLARAMFVAMQRSTPKQVGYGEWHLPFVGAGTLEVLEKQMLDRGELGAGAYRDYHEAKITTPIPIVRSVVCCARTSYHAFGDNARGFGKDLPTWVKLVGGRIKHASPTGHQGTPLHPAQAAAKPHLESNLFGWEQFRRRIPGENIIDFEPSANEVAAWQVPEDVFIDDDDFVPTLHGVVVE